MVLKDYLKDSAKLFLCVCVSTLFLKMDANIAVSLKKRFISTLFKKARFTSRIFTAYLHMKFPPKNF